MRIRFDQQREAKRNALRRVDRFIRNRLTPLTKRPVIFLGKGKSGTTAIAGLFAEATGKSVALDIPALFIDGIRPILRGEKSLDRVVRKNRVAFSRDVLKQPTLTWLYPQLRASFPEAEYLMIVRDPRDNIRSVFNRMGISGRQRDLTGDEREAIHPGWKWHFTEPELLGMAQGTHIELSAERWNLAADVYLRHKNQIVLVRYEDFMADRVAFIDRLASTLGTELVNDITPLVNHQYQPKGGDRGRSWEEFFGSENLAMIVELCGSRMRLLGYDTACTEPGYRCLG